MYAKRLRWPQLPAGTNNRSAVDRQQDQLRSIVECLGPHLRASNGWPDALLDPL